MPANFEDQLIDKARSLPPNKQEEALRLLDNLAKSEFNETLWVANQFGMLLNQINTELPTDTWEMVPTDGSINLYHYLYGAPKWQQ